MVLAGGDGRRWINGGLYQWELILGAGPRHVKGGPLPARQTSAGDPRAGVCRPRSHSRGQATGHVTLACIVRSLPGVRGAHPRGACLDSRMAPIRRDVQPGHLRVWCVVGQKQVDDDAPHRCPAVSGGRTMGYHAPRRSAARPSSRPVPYDARHRWLATFGQNGERRASGGERRLRAAAGGPRVHPGPTGDMRHVSAARSSHWSRRTRHTRTSGHRSSTRQRRHGERRSSSPGASRAASGSRRLR
jgi:hypothetical protein